MARKVGDWVMFDDGDVGQRPCRIAALQPGRIQVETHPGTESRPAICVWVNADSFRIVDTPAHHRHRATDRPTAVAAARKVKAGTGKMKVLLALFDAGEHGLIDHDHATVNGLIATSAGKRRLDLMNDHTPPLVADSGRTRNTPSGEPAVVWTLTDAGYTMASQLRTSGAA